jgi:hypothetical protein
VQGKKIKVNILQQKKNNDVFFFEKPILINGLFAKVKNYINSKIAFRSTRNFTLFIIAVITSNSMFLILQFSIVNIRTTFV